MATPPKPDITQWLLRYNEGDRDALDKLFPLVYAHLRRIAAHQVNRQRSGGTLVPTALVHEGFLRLIQKKEIRYNDRSHFYAVAAQCMRWILMDYAKASRRHKRGGGGVRVSFDEKIHSDQPQDFDLVAVDAALEKLARQEPRLAQVVELRYLTGLSIEETAQVLSVSPATVKRDWSLAKAWLNRELERARAA